MSTKTSFKRIAAVAAVALTLGGFSAVSAHATAGTPLQSISALGGTSIVNGGAGVNSTVSGVVGGYVGETVTADTQDHYYTIVSTGVGSLALSSAGSQTVTNPVSNYSINSGTSVTWFASTAPGLAVFAAGSILSFSATSAVAGTQTITVTGDVGGAVKETITWGAAPVVTSQYSTAYIAATTVTPDVNTNAVAVTASKSLTTQAAAIVVTLNSAASAPITGQGLAASISGPGLIGLYANSTPVGVATGRSLSIAAASSNGSQFSIPVFADGTAGVATITITSGTVTIGTKTVTFTGVPATATATQGLYVLKAGGTTAGAGLGATPTGVEAVGSSVTTTVALTAQVLDAAGVGVNPSAVKIVSSDSTVISAGSCVQVTATAGEYECSVSGSTGALSGQSATVTFEVYNAATAAYDIVAAPLTYTIGKAVATVALATDSASYASLAPIKLVATAKDSSGNAAYDQDVPLFGATLISSTQLGGTLLPGATAVALINGKHTFSGFYAPSSAADFTISGVDGTTTAAAVSVSATSTGSSADAAAQAAIDAAQEATDAANAAYDAANNAMDSADAATAAAQDASDNASAALAAVTSLSATVAKLVSSVTAIATALASIKKKLGVK